MSGAAPPRFRFFAGKGGVGKTTCAAAAALAAASASRVLVVSTDPAHSLGDALDAELGPAPLAVPLPGERRRRGRGLDACELDADAALARWVAERREALAAGLERGTYLDRGRVERLLDLSLPGVDELIGLLELERLGVAGAYDEVFVDTAPTGHALRLLQTPEALARLGEVLDRLQAKHRFLAARFGGRARRDAVDAVVEELAESGRRLAELLRDPARVAVTWVLLPEALALEETADGVAALEAAGIAVSELIVNRLAPVDPDACVTCAERAGRERAVVRELEERLPGRRLRVVPALEAEPRAPAALRAVARCLAAAPDSSPRRRARGRGARSGPRRGGRAWRDALVPPGSRLLLVAGKGGVGKTTCAAATALAWAERLEPGEELLLLSVDPAHSLGDALDLELDDEERVVPGTKGRLVARELDAEAALERERARYRAGVEAMFEGLSGSLVDVSFDREAARDLLELAPPGLDELLGILTVADALVPAEGEAPYRGVVLDAAPTGHALRLLELPALARDWVRVFLEVLLEYHQAVGVRIEGVAQDLMSLSRRLRGLERLLHDPAQARVLAVSRAGALPARETERLLLALERLGIDAPALLVNAVEAGRCPVCRVPAAAPTVEVGRPALMIEAPRVEPPPVGATALAAWSRSWRVAPASRGARPAARQAEAP